MTSIKKTMIITGGSGSIGSAIAREAPKRGWVPVIVYNTNEESAKLLQKELSEAMVISCDVTKGDQARALVEKTLSQFGRIDAFVHCSSPAIAYAKFEKKTEGDFREHMGVTFFGAVNCLKHIIPQMMKQKGGSVISILTQNVFGTPQPGFSDYIAAKYALLGLTKCLAAEYKAVNVRANAVSPGMVETRFLRNLPLKAIELEKEASPTGRLTSPHDVADVVFSLLEGQETGAHIAVIGGAVQHGAC